MDLSNLDTTTRANEGVDMELVHPDGSGIVLVDEATGEPLVITLCGLDSKQFLQAAHRLNREKAKSRREADLSNDENVRLMAACTKAWRHIYFESVDPLPCTVENATMLYTQRPWILEQVNRFVASRANYLGN